MHILYLDPHPVPDPAPESLQILQTVDGLGRIGVRVTLATPAPKGGLRPEDVLGRPLPPTVTARPIDDWRDRWWYPSRSGRHFVAEARRLVAAATDVDALLVRNLKLADALLDLPRRPPMIFETHEVFARTFAEDHPSPSRREAGKLAKLRAREGRVYLGAEGLAALTEPLIEDLRADYGTSRPAVVVPDGVDAEVLRREPTPLDRNRDEPRLLYLGSLHPWKGVDVLVRAIPMVRRGRLVVAGGPAKRVDELRALAETLGVAGRIDFLGEVAPGRRFDVIADADVCLLPLGETSIASRYTSPLKLFEYMGLGRPVISADLPSIRAVVTSGVDGLLVPVGAPDRLAQAIDGLLDDPERAAALGRAARIRAADFTWDRRADTLRRFAEELKERA